ncbi:Hypothetical predicted protein [Xyrichtys novacula]|uniref:Uncharacterized protein n=1 Tax=Xyrichtys novacula TaxID=13765 RepID=A0AAV1F4P2_XYRNO|nr:Hypothetical predicted protein [Xyrichtys novacula]
MRLQAGSHTNRKMRAKLRGGLERSEDRKHENLEPEQQTVNRRESERHLLTNKPALEIITTQIKEKNHNE